MSYAVLYSGGKDSNLALYYGLKNVKCLISIISKNPYSFMFHTPNIWLTKYQAKAIGLPIIIKKTKGEKEKELKDLEIAIKKAKKIYNIEGVISGAVKSKYQKERIDKICKKLKIKHYAPLWQKKEEEIIEEIKKLNFEVIVTGIFAWPLTKEHVGKNFFEILDILKEKGINIIGEGGEIETLVLDALFFKKKIKIIDAKIEGENNTWIYKIKKIKLLKK
ncbi:MAG: diphthine--ammonia ligase [Candidatus Pacearchaeota archaeon]